MNSFLNDPPRGRAAYLAAQLALPDGTDPRTDDPAAIWSFAMDGNTPVCMTLDMLDEWWRSKSPQEKAEIWDRSLEADPQAEAEEIMALALAAAQHPLNVIFAQAERLADQHKRAIADIDSHIDRVRHRCRHHA